MVESATIFPSKLKREYYLFSKSGFTSDLIDSNMDNVHLYTLNDLFSIFHHLLIGSHYIKWSGKK